MSDFLVAMSPAILFWTIPVMPMFVTGVVATVETLTVRERRSE